MLGSVKLHRRSLYTDGKSDELDPPIRVGSGFKVKPPHSTKAIFNMNLDRGRINGFTVCAQYSEFEGTGTCAALYDGNLFVVRLRFRKKRDCDDDEAQNTKHSVQILTIIRTRPRDGNAKGAATPAAWHRISQTLTSRGPSNWKATGWRSWMARLGGVCSNVCADLANYAVQ